MAWTLLAVLGENVQHQRDLWKRPQSTPTDILVNAFHYIMPKKGAVLRYFTQFLLIKEKVIIMQDKKAAIKINFNRFLNTTTYNLLNKSLYNTRIPGNIHIKDTINNIKNGIE